VSAAAILSAPPRHLLVRLPNPLGDAVMATPALRALRETWTETRITWAGGPAAQSALEGLPWRDDVMPVGDRDGKGRSAPFRAGRILKALGADAALLMPNSFSSALAVRRAGIPVRIGSSLHGRRALLTHVVPVAKGADGKLAPRTMVDHYLDLVAPLGIPAGVRTPELRTTPFDEERAARRLSDAPRDLPWLGINPGAAFGATKVYPPERIAAAVRAVEAERPVWPVVFCGPGEQGLAAEVARHLAPHVTSCHDDVPDLGELKALLRRMAVLATTDAGPRHVAEALGTPTVVWMGPTDPRWSDHSPATVVRQEGLDCLACHRKACPIGLPCMRELDPVRVARAILDRLAGPGGPAAPSSL